MNKIRTGVFSAILFAFVLPSSAVLFWAILLLTDGMSPNTAVMKAIDPSSISEVVSASKEAALKMKQCEQQTGQAPLCLFDIDSIKRFDLAPGIGRLYGDEVEFYPLWNMNFVAGYAEMSRPVWDGLLLLISAPNADAALKEVEELERFMTSFAPSLQILKHRWEVEFYIAMMLMSILTAMCLYFCFALVREYLSDVDRMLFRWFMRREYAR